MGMYTNLFLSIDHDNCCHSDHNAKIQTQCLLIFKKLKESTVYLYRKLLSKIQLLAVKIKQINHDFNNYYKSKAYNGSLIYFFNHTKVNNIEFQMQHRPDEIYRHNRLYMIVRLSFL